MRLDNQTMGVLFLVVIIILAVIPKIVHQFYNTILGRVLLISIVIYFTMNNMTLGLITALVIITASNQFGSFVEGMENNGETIGDDNSNTNVDSVTQKILTKSEAIKDKKNEANAGFDKEDIKAAIASKDSKTIPIDNNMNSSEEVSAFTSGMLKTSPLEGFSAYSPAF